MRAVCMIRPEPHYRRDAFLSGLKAAGYGEILTAPGPFPEPGDLLVIWNRYGRFHEEARRFESRGAHVVVAENGWIGTDRKGHQPYALCLGHHNGAGRWTVGDMSRAAMFNIALQPWRKDGKHILVLPSRGIGPPGVAQPLGWTERVVERLKKRTNRPIRVRPHPGREKLDPGPDLEGAWAAVTWASGAGIKAIAAGIPVFYDMLDWIGAPAACLIEADLERPFMGDRAPMFHRLSWAQFTVDEIAAGIPFRCLLGSR